MARRPSGKKYRASPSNLVLSAAGLVARAFFAYGIGFWLYIGFHRLTDQFPEFGPEVRSVMLLFLVGLAIFVLLFPLVQYGWDPVVRDLTALSALAIFSVTVLQAAGLWEFDPEWPVDYLLRDTFLPWVFHSEWATSAKWLPFWLR